MRLIVGDVRYNIMSSLKNKHTHNRVDSAGDRSGFQHVKNVTMHCI